MILSNFFDLIRFEKNIALFLICAISLICSEILLFDIDDVLLTYLLALNVDVLVASGYIYFAKKENSLFNHYSFFWLSISFFTFGHIILFSFGLESENMSIIANYPIEMVNKYILYGLFSFVTLFFSGVIVLNLSHNLHQEKVQILFNDNAKKVFIFFFVISAPVFIYYITHKLNVSVQYGYAQVYESSENGNSLVGSIRMWFIPSLFALIYLYKDSFLKYLFLLFLAIPIIIPLMIGTRSTPFTIIICLIYLWNAAIRTFKKKETLAVLLLCCLFAVLMPTIAEYRNLSTTSFETVLFKNVYSGVPDILEKTLGEFGGSAQIWLRLQHIVPGMYGYNFGFSYLASVLTCIPSVLLGGFSFAVYANLSDWITSIEKTSYGLGFSYLGELYYNFGWLGVLASFFVGFFMFYTLSCLWLPRMLTKYKYIFSTIALFIFSTIGRDSIYLGVRYIFYAMIIPALLIYLTREKK